MQHQLEQNRQSKPRRGRAGGRLLVLVLAAYLSACHERSAAQRWDDTLTMLLPRDAQQIDPRFVSDAYGLKLSRLLFASLMRIDPHTLEPVPDLAERVEVVSEVEYRVELRPGLRFSDGSVLDADDVQATYRSVVDPELHTRYASAYQRIERVEVLDPLTLSFHLNGPHASFLSDLELPILRSEDAHRRLALDDAARDPAAIRSAAIGAGPYVLAGRRPGAIELEANPHWYGGAPHVPHVRMLVVRDDNTRALRLLSGAADLTLNSVPPGLLPLFTPAKGFSVETAPGIGTTFLGLNTEAPGLDDVRVRRAIALAVDRAGLIAAKLAGRAEPARSFVPNGHWAYDEQLPLPQFDPSAARAQLDAAGLRARGDGPRVSWVMRCSSDRFRVSVARAIAAMLEEVGLHVRVQPSETPTLLADLNKGRFELALLEFPEVIEPHVLSWVFASERIPGQGREGLNRWRFRDAAVDAAFERGRKSLAREERKRAYAEIQQRIADQVPVVPLWHESVVVVRTQKAPLISVPRDGRFTTLARAH